MQPNGVSHARDTFDFLLNAPALFNAVATALETGVFDFLAEHPGSTRAEIGNAVGINDHQMRVLLQAVCCTGLLDKEADRYRNSTIAEEELLGSGTDSWRRILPGWRAIYYPAFARLTDALRTGTNTALDAFPGTEPTLYQRIKHDPDKERIFHDAMSAFSERSVGALVQRQEFADVKHLLDVGGGDGMTARHLVDRHPDLTVTIFDLPSVTAIARAATHNERISVRPGDLFGDEFPRGVDAVLFSHVLEVFAERDILTLLRKAFAVLPPGGKIISYHHHVSDDERSGLYSARLSLYLTALATGEGMAYPVADYVRWLHEVGCDDVTSVAGLPYEHAVVVGTKPSRPLPRSRSCAI
jgi:trans-aconitate methyltransferase